MWTLQIFFVAALGTTVIIAPDSMPDVEMTGYPSQEACEAQSWGASRQAVSRCVEAAG